MHASSFSNLKNSPLKLDPAHLTLVQSILQSYVPHSTVCAFGSRVSGTPKPASDLDLVIMASKPLDLKIMDALQEAFATSTLPMKVDIVDWQRISPAFRDIIERQMVMVWKGGTDVW